MAWDTTVFSGAPMDGRFAFDNSQWSVATGKASAGGSTRSAQPSVMDAVGVPSVAAATYGVGGSAVPMLMLAGGAALVLLLVLRKRKKGG